MRISRKLSVRPSLIGAAIATAVLANATPAAETPKIALAPGLTIVTAVSESTGDYESIKLVESADATSFRILYSSESPHDEGIDVDPSPYKQYRPNPTQPGTVLCLLKVHRNVLRSDLKTADHYLRIFDTPPMVAETVPGTTAIGTSSAVLKALKSAESVAFTTYLAAFYTDPITSADSTAGSMMDTREQGTLRRVEPGVVPIPVIVNGRLVNLPAIHARGELGIDASDLYFLDDPDNPLTLRFTIGNEKLTVIKINTPADGAAPPASGGSGGGGGGGKGTDAVATGNGNPSGEAANIEQSLSNTRHADIYGIYFSYNSDAIRPESEPVLREISGLLMKHADWKLDVNGHTDSIGGQKFNQELSARRAQAVIKALTDHYHIATARLAAAGYGLTQPKAPNDTLEGRALNRRVELVRQ